MALKVAVLIPAAGAGTRFKGKRKKQFAELNGRAVFLRSIEIFSDREDVKLVSIAIPPDEQELFQVKFSANLGFYGVKHILGGPRRPDTIKKLLDLVNDDDFDLIALHDAVRPCVTKQQIDNIFAAAAESGAAILAAPLVGTIKQIDKDNNIYKTIDRSKLWQAQTPQVFKPQIIRQAYQNPDKIDDNITDDAQLVENLGIPVKIVPSDNGNIKITTNTDLAIASAILKAQPKPKQKGPTGPWAAEQGW